MTNEEAKMQIQAIPEKIWDQLSEPDREAMEMAFSALEKQIPKEPIPICPICHKEIVVGNMHCIRCGQRIFWEEEDDERGKKQILQEWIPCKPLELPKDKKLWVTHSAFGYRYVTRIFWDMTGWNDNVSDVVAYIPYVEPEPYKEKEG